MTNAYINRIATAVPPYDIHEKFVSYAPTLLPDTRSRQLFSRMAARSQIAHRYSYLTPHANNSVLDGEGFYRTGQFPDTATRMQRYEHDAPKLAFAALQNLALDTQKDQVTHLIVTTCTGFYAPGIDLQIIRHLGLNPIVERSIIGFMGCYAGITALKAARHIVRSVPNAKILIVNIELCTLHLQQGSTLEEMLSFMLFADGCATSLVSADPVGIEIQSFTALQIPDTKSHITWHIGDHGFDMVLSGKVPQALTQSLRHQLPAILQGSNPVEITHWALHPGGRSVLDAAEEGIGLPPGKLTHSRDILHRYGNMSSATIMFVLQSMLQGTQKGRGCAMAFGPGIMAETMLFQMEG